MKVKDLLFISYLRNNARESLTNLSKKTNIPVSTLYDRLRYQKDKLICKHTTLLNFSELGYRTLAKILLKVARKDHDIFLSFVNQQYHVNSLFKMAGEYDFLLDVVFEDMVALDSFLSLIEKQFCIENLKTLYVIREEFKEKFLSDPLGIKV